MNDIKNEFSVLMSVYIKEKPEYLIECFESLLSQTVKASEWVIVIDGKITDELSKVLKEYYVNYSSLIKFVVLNENQGLGIALAEGIKHCKYSLVARMDTDDVCSSDRFEKQLAEFNNNKNLDICGSYIKEFEKNIKNVVSERLVPIEDSLIKKYQKRRSAFNHMTVMYKRDSVLAAGNYQHALLMEDDLLWVNMMKIGCQCKNIPEYLVFARVGNDMIKRRGGLKYFRKYKMGRKQILDTGYISVVDYYYTLVVQLVVSLMPLSVRKKFFKKMLRKKR